MNQMQRQLLLKNRAEGFILMSKNEVLESIVRRRKTTIIYKSIRNINVKWFRRMSPILGIKAIVMI